MQLPPPDDSTGSPASDKPAPTPPKKATATQFFLKGLAISLPPILTLVILIWIGQMLYGYVVSPITTGVRFVIAEIIDKSRPTSELVSATGLPPLEYCGTNYRIPREVEARLRARALQGPDKGAKTNGRGPNDSIAATELASVAYVPFGEWSVPYVDFEEVASRMRPSEWPATVTGLYMELVTVRYFKSLGSLSALATALTIIALYFLGRFVTARMGQWVVSRFETLVLARVPIISSVYSSVKQVTDFFFSERPLAYNRVVAVEFPRRGVWTIGFAMGESMMELTLTAGEPLISVMIPAAPMPMTGWVVSVPKSVVIDLNLTLDQAFQYYLSCGVLVPEHERATPELLHRELARRLAESFGPGGTLARPPGAGPQGIPPLGMPPGSFPPSNRSPLPPNDGDDASRTYPVREARFPDRLSDEGTPLP
jgi:uncharacterized membrane protein